MQPSTFTQEHAPRITFQDTNVVGNVYFLTFCRWQAECRDAWLKSALPDLWHELSIGHRRLLVTHWLTRFEDPFGATIGDDVAAMLSVEVCDDHSFNASIGIFKRSGNASTRIASGSMRFTTQTDFEPPHNDHPTGPCYQFSPVTQALNPLELLAWQGKCRELFLADHAAETLRSVANRKLILQTTTAAIDLVRSLPVTFDSMHVEMRLETLKCGQMGVRFDYFAETVGGETVRFAKGRQVMSSKHEHESAVVPCPLPVDLLTSLRRFTNSDQLQDKIDDILTFSTERSPTATSGPYST